MFYRNKIYFKINFVTKMHSLYRTEYIKHTQYNGDGKGRDGYIVFCNGGLNELRRYKGSTPTTAFTKNPMHRNYRTPVAHKEASAFDYVPDG